MAAALGATGCAGGGAAPADAPPDAPVAEAAMTHVSAHGVSALVPDGWVARAEEGAVSAVGLRASPGPPAGRRPLPSQGLIATRIDASQVGAPSDLYYLAAKGPLIARITQARGCQVTRREVYADHRPTWLAGRVGSPGDFIAAASGRCTRHGKTTRWAYFVAAPGFGPARERGIPGSGLYLIVASMPAAPGASRTLAAMVGNVRFGQDGASDFVQAVRAA